MMIYFSLALQLFMSANWIDQNDEVSKAVIQLKNGIQEKLGKLPVFQLSPE